MKNFSAFREPIIAYYPNAVPLAVAPVVTGLIQVGQVISAYFDYFDEDGDLAGTHTYQWRRANDGVGTGEVDIAGATGVNYTLVSGDSAKYVRCKITPKALTGSLTGALVNSPYYYVSNYGTNLYPNSAGNLPDHDTNGLVSDGSFAYVNDSIATATPTIVSGNGFTYNAQRLIWASGSGSIKISMRDVGGSNKMQVGVTYLVEFEYRSNKTFFARGTGGTFTPNQNNIPVNTGSALPYSFEVTVGTVSDLQFQILSATDATFWFEFGKVSVREKLA